MDKYKVFNKQEELVTDYGYEQFKSMLEQRDLVNSYDKQCREANERREQQEILNAKDKARKKAMALVVAVMLAAGGIGIAHVDHVMKERLPHGDDYTHEETSVTYDDFIDYCDYMTEVTGVNYPITKENYTQAVKSGALEQYVKENSKGNGRGL